MVISTSSVFGLSIDMICLMFTSCIIFYYVFFGRDVSGDQIGLAITQAMVCCFFSVIEFFWYTFLIDFFSEKGLNGMVQWGM